MATIPFNPRKSQTDSSVGSGDQIALRVLRVAVSILFAWVLWQILREYRWYFPANFSESAFLSGRRYTFDGWYPAAFYIHIITGPIVLLASAALMTPEFRNGWPRWHRRLGRVHIGVLLLLMVPSGLAMAMKAYSGPVAGTGFAMHGIVTGLCAVMAITHARRRNFSVHQAWATRCFLMLCAPLLLRLINGAIQVAGAQSTFTYQLIAWISWLLPMLIHEIWRAIKSRLPSAYG